MKGLPEMTLGFTGATQWPIRFFQFGKERHAIEELHHSAGQFYIAILVNSSGANDVKSAMNAPRAALLWSDPRSWSVIVALAFALQKFNPQAAFARKLQFHGGILA